MVLPAYAAGKTDWYLRLPDEGVSEPIARRTLALELRELDIPADPRRTGERADEVSLFIEVTRAAKGWKVELWDRGEFGGSRTVSSGGHPSTVGRRVALAAGELARELIARRVRKKRRLLQEEIERKERERAERRAERLGRPTIHAAFDTLWLPEGGWLMGPGVALDLNRNHPLRIRLGLSWMAGSLPALAPGTLTGDPPRWSQVDFKLDATWSWAKDLHQWELGPQLAGSAVHLGGAGEADAIPRQRDTWSARGGVTAGWSYSFSTHIAARLALNGGFILRNLPVAYGMESVSLGGGYVGTTLAFSVTP